MLFGFVGLGQMGKPMALNLARQHKVLAFDARPVLLPEDAPLSLVLAESLEELDDVLSQIRRFDGVYQSETSLLLSTKRASQPRSP